MKIDIEHLDSHGVIHNISLDLQYIQFVKHMAFAGMGVHKSVANVYRFVAFMMEFTPYWQNNQNYFVLLSSAELNSAVFSNDFYV